MNTQKPKIQTKQLVLAGMLAAILILFSFLPIGSIPVGPLVITLNTIPVALAAIAMGPAGGAAMGAFFGMLSFLQCFGIGVASGMGAILVNINPFFAFVQRFVPRLLDGFLLGYIFRDTARTVNPHFGFFMTGFCAAFLNTVFFMTALILLFGNTEYVQGLQGQRNVLLFVINFVGLNAVVEMIASTIITGAVATALHQAKLIQVPTKQ